MKDFVDLLHQKLLTQKQVNGGEGILVTLKIKIDILIDGMSAIMILRFWVEPTE